MKAISFVFQAVYFVSLTAFGGSYLPCFIHAYLTHCTERAHARLAPGSAQLSLQKQKVRKAWQQGRGEAATGRSESHHVVCSSVPSNCPWETRAKQGRFHAVPFESIGDSFERFCWIKMANLLVVLFQNPQNLQICLSIYLEQMREKCISNIT